MAIGLAMGGTKHHRKSKVSDPKGMKLFLNKGEVLNNLQGGFDCQLLPSPWDEVCFMIMKYFILKGRFRRFFHYHFILLNHFRHSKHINFPFFLLSSLETSIVATKEQHTLDPSKLELPLHQGLIMRLYKFHLALYPPKAPTPIRIEPHNPPRVMEGPVIITEVTPNSYANSLKIGKKKTLVSISLEPTTEDLTPTSLTTTPAKRKILHGSPPLSSKKKRGTLEEGYDTVSEIRTTKDTLVVEEVSTDEDNGDLDSAEDEFTPPLKESLISLLPGGRLGLQLN